MDLLVAGGERVPTQEVGRNERSLADEHVAGDDLAALFRRVHDRELLGRQVTRVDIDGAARWLDFHVAAVAGD